VAPDCANPRFHLFAGLSIDEAAETLGLSRATAFREWAYARSWLTTALAAGDRNHLEATEGSREGESERPDLSV
jgi:hypothetical protein